MSSRFLRGEEQRSRESKCLVLRCIAKGPPWRQSCFIQSHLLSGPQLGRRNLGSVVKRVVNARGTRSRGEAEENESETCGVRRVREVAAGIKHKTVYIRWRRGPLKGHRAVGWPRRPVSSGAGWSSRLLSRPILPPSRCSHLYLSLSFSSPFLSATSFPFSPFCFYSCPSYFPFGGVPYSPRSGAPDGFRLRVNLLRRLAKPWIPRSDANLCFNWNRKSSVKARTTGRPNVINRSKRFRSTSLPNRRVRREKYMRDVRSSLFAFRCAYIHQREKNE